MLAETGEVIGETKDALSMYGQLKEGKQIILQNSISIRNGQSN